VDIFEFFVVGAPLSQQPEILLGFENGKNYVRSEAAKLWSDQEPHEGNLKLTVVNYHERQSVLIDHDNMIKPIQDALAGLVYLNDRQITDAQTRKPTSTGDSNSGISRPYTPVLSLAEKPPAKGSRSLSR
jgi:crossover junction endodeoxyribonuclease RusA